MGGIGPAGRSRRLTRHEAEFRPRTAGILAVDVARGGGSLHARPDNQRLSPLPAGQLAHLIVVLNEKLLEVMGDDVTQEQAFAHANDVLKNAVGGDITTAATASTSRVSSTSTSKT